MAVCMAGGGYEVVGTALAGEQGGQERGQTGWMEEGGWDSAIPFCSPKLSAPSRHPPPAPHSNPLSRSPAPLPPPPSQPPIPAPTPPPPCCPLLAHVQERLGATLIPVEAECNLGEERQGCVGLDPGDGWNGGYGRGAWRLVLACVRVYVCLRMCVCACVCVCCSFAHGWEWWLGCCPWRVCMRPQGAVIQCGGLWGFLLGLALSMVYSKQ